MRNKHYHYLIGYAHTSGFGHCGFNTDKPISPKYIPDVLKFVRDRSNLDDVSIISISPLECDCE